MNKGIFLFNSSLPGAGRRKHRANPGGIFSRQLYQDNYFLEIPTGTGGAQQAAALSSPADVGTQQTLSPPTL
jgi:hypothetical protein